MQVTQKQIQRQQEILALLGFYQGKLDGIWGPKCIEAKKRFESDPKFIPGIPNNGLPFADRGPFPALISINHATNLLEHPSLKPTPAAVMATQVQKAKDVEDDDAEVTTEKE